MNSQKVVEILNDLVQINNDRIAGYQNAATQLEAGYDNLQELFKKMIEESKLYNSELALEISHLQGTLAEGTSGAGKLYRAWMDMRAFISGGNARPVLETCETVESAIQKAYEDALDEEGLQGSVHALIARQKTLLLESHAQIKHLIEITNHESD